MTGAAPVTPGWTEAGGLKTYLLRSGTGEPVVFLHGLGASSYSWRRLLPLLAPDHEVFAPDFPGYGRSDKPGRFDYTFAGFSRWLAAFLDACGLRRAVLVGSSMGGAVALRLALDEPERVSKLVLIGAPVSLADAPRLLSIMRRPWLSRLLEPLLGRWAVRLVAPTAYLDQANITPDLLDEYSLALRTRAGRHAVAETMRRCISPDLPGVIRRYALLEPPVLFIRGDHDAVVGGDSADNFCRTVPHGRLLQLPDCGHLPQEEKPEAVAAALAEFLGRGLLAAG